MHKLAYSLIIPLHFFELRLGLGKNKLPGLLHIDKSVQHRKTQFIYDKTISESRCYGQRRSPY